MSWSGLLRNSDDSRQSTLTRFKNHSDSNRLSGSITPAELQFYFTSFGNTIRCLWYPTMCIMMEIFVRNDKKCKKKN